MLQNESVSETPPPFRASVKLAHRSDRRPTSPHLCRNLLSNINQPSRSSCFFFLEAPVCEARRTPCLQSRWLSSGSVERRGWCPHTSCENYKKAASEEWWNTMARTAAIDRSPRAQLSRSNVAPLPTVDVKRRKDWAQ